MQALRVHYTEGEGGDDSLLSKTLLVFDSTPYAIASTLGRCELGGALSTDTRSGAFLSSGLRSAWGFSLSVENGRFGSVGRPETLLESARKLWAE